MLAQGKPRDSVITSLEALKGTEKGAAKALKYAQDHMHCRKCGEVKKVTDFPKETSHHCNDCRPEAKGRIFCLFEKETHERIVALAKEAGQKPHEWLHDLAVANLPES